MTARESSARRRSRAAAVLITVAAAVGVLPTQANAVTTVPPTVVVNGGGLGHGAGMSQWGARGLALEGRTGEQIVAHYYTGAAAAVVRDDVDLRVNLLHDVTSVKLKSESLGTGGGTLAVILAGVGTTAAGPTDTFTVAMAGTATLQVTRTAAGGAVTVLPPTTAVTVRWGGTRFLAGGPTLVDVAGPGEALGDASGRYRDGGLEITVVGGNLEVNVVLRLHDEYLNGIAEMPSSWPRQALRAQVMAARSFALTAYTAGRRSQCSCHLYDTVMDQVYAGWSKQSEPGGAGAAWMSAVRSTAASTTTGALVAVGGVPVRAYFFSSSGGRTRNSEDVWSAPLSYARSVDDHWSQDPANPYGAWYRTFDAEQVRTRVFPSLPDLAKVLVFAKDSGGGLRWVRAWSTSGATADVSGPTFKALLALPSLWVWTVESTLPGQAVVDLASTPGYHLSGTREWRTDCHQYQAAPQDYATLCVVNIKGYSYVPSGSSYQTVYGWVVNNLTFLDRVRPGWNTHVLAVPGEHRTSGGAPLRTECTPALATGPRECRSWVYIPVVAKTATGYQVVNVWDFYSIVRLTA